MTPQIDCLRKTSPVLRVSTHIYCILKENDGKTFIFQVNLGMWPLKSIVSEKQSLCWGFQHTFIAFWRRMMGKHSFSSKHRHVTPQIDCLRKTNPILMFSTYISGHSKEIDVKMFIFQVNIGMWPLKSINSEKRAMFWSFQHTFLAFLRR